MIQSKQDGLINEVFNTAHQFGENVQSLEDYK